MQTLVSRRMAEANGRVRWSASDITTALNLGYAEVSDATEWFEQHLVVDLLWDRPWYDLLHIIGENILSLRPAFNETMNQWLVMTTSRFLDGRDRRWERVQGEPQRMLRKGWRWLGLFPRVQADSGTIKLYFTALPDPMVDDTDQPGFPDQFHMTCVDWACADLFAQDGEAALAERSWAAYVIGEQDFTAWVQTRANAPMTRIVGAAGTGR